MKVEREARHFLKYGARLVFNVKPLTLPSALTSHTVGPIPHRYLLQSRLSCILLLQDPVLCPWASHCLLNELLGHALAWVFGFTGLEVYLTWKIWPRHWLILPPGLSVLILCYDYWALTYSLIKQKYSSCPSFIWGNLNIIFLIGISQIFCRKQKYF